MSSVNILLVDDSSVMRSILRQVIQNCGLSVGKFYEASNGQEALKHLETQAVDLLFVDLNMPVMNGFQLIEAMRSHPAYSRLPVLVVSTESNPVRIDALTSKGIRFVNKPFIPEQIRASVQKIMGEC